jgi:hypothetical protein
MWQYIPVQFSMEHLPDRDTRLALVDEEEEEFRILYRPHSSSFNAGWRDFAEDHELVDGDCLVFQLVKKKLFKVRFLVGLHCYGISVDIFSAFEMT